MNALDFIIIAIVSYNAFVGLKQGAVYTISGLIALVAATSISKVLWEATYQPIGQHLPFCNTYPFLYYALCFIAMLMVFQVISKLIHALFKWTGVGFINHSLGLGLGAARGIIFALIIAAPLTAMNTVLASNSVLVHQCSPMIVKTIVWLDESNIMRSMLNTEGDMLRSATK
jgi:Uncharacterized membrane protein, required for colicin V production